MYNREGNETEEVSEARTSQYSNVREKGNNGRNTLREKNKVGYSTGPGKGMNAGYNDRRGIRETKAELAKKVKITLCLPQERRRV